MENFSDFQRQANRALPKGMPFATISDHGRSDMSCHGLIVTKRHQITDIAFHFPGLSWSNFHFYLDNKHFILTEYYWNF